MKNESVRHSRNWNNKFYSDCFATSRVWDQHKYKLGQVYSHFIGDEWVGDAKLITINKVPFGKITDGMALMDLGKSKAQLLHLFKSWYREHINAFGENAPFAYLIFRFTSKNLKYATSTTRDAA